MTDAQKINDAWQTEGSRGRLGRLPAGDPDILKEIIPAGGEWTCIATTGAKTRYVIWNGIEICLVNPRCDLSDRIEGEIAMGLRATPAIDKALRCILILAEDPENLGLIQRIARTVITYVEMPAPAFPEPNEGED